MKTQAELNALHSRDPGYLKALEEFPRPGAKLRYRGTRNFWFTNIIANAERELRLGETYTLQTIELASSWACITLAETGTPNLPSAFSMIFLSQIKVSEHDLVGCPSAIT